MQSTTDTFEDLRKDFPVLNRRVRDNKKLANQITEMISKLRDANF